MYLWRNNNEIYYTNRKETEEQILTTLQREKTIEQILKSAVR